MLREVIKDDPSPYVKYIEYIEEDKILGYLKYSLIYDRMEIDNILVEPVPCGGLFFQAVKHFLFCGGAFRPQGKKLCKGQLYRFGKIGLAAFKVNPALDPHSAGRF